MSVVNSDKQQALDSDRKAIQQINFTANLDRTGNARIYFIYCFGLFTRNCKIFVSASSLNTILLSNLIFINIK